MIIYDLIHSHPLLVILWQPNQNQDESVSFCHCFQHLRNLRLSLDMSLPHTRAWGACCPRVPTSQPIPSPSLLSGLFMEQLQMPGVLPLPSLCPSLFPWDGVTLSFAVYFYVLPFLLFPCMFQFITLFSWCLLSLPLLSSHWLSSMMTSLLHAHQRLLYPLQTPPNPNAIHTFFSWDYLLSPLNQLESQSFPHLLINIILVVTYVQPLRCWNP